MVKSLVSIFVSLVFLVSQLGLASGAALADEPKPGCHHCDCGGSNCCVNDSVPQQDIPPGVPRPGEKLEDHQPLQSWISCRTLSLKTVCSVKNSSINLGICRFPNVPIFLFIGSILI